MASRLTSGRMTQHIEVSPRARDIVLHFDPKILGDHGPQIRPKIFLRDKKWTDGRKWCVFDTREFSYHEAKLDMRSCSLHENCPPLCHDDEMYVGLYDTDCMPLWEHPPTPPADNGHFPCTSLCLDHPNPCKKRKISKVDQNGEITDDDGEIETGLQNLDGARHEEIGKVASRIAKFLEEEEKKKKDGNAYDDEDESDDCLLIATKDSASASQSMCSSTLATIGASSTEACGGVNDQNFGNEYNSEIKLPKLLPPELKWYKTPFQLIKYNYWNGKGRNGKGMGKKKNYNHHKHYQLIKGEWVKTEDCYLPLSNPCSSSSSSSNSSEYEQPLSASSSTDYEALSSANSENCDYHDGENLYLSIYDLFDESKSVDKRIHHDNNECESKYVSTSEISDYITVMSDMINKIDEKKETTRMKLTKIAKFVKKAIKIRKGKKNNYKLQIDVTPQ